jgi:type IV secretory pathway TraG/TraD family ATPase VirD4
MIFDLANISYIGKTVFDADFGISQNDRRRHLHIIGQTGTGKSTALLHLISQDLAMGRGIALLDPHGDLAERALTLIPRRRAHQLVYLNPTDLSRPIGYNVLGDVHEDHRPVVAEGVISAFKHVWPDSWGPRLEHFLLNSIRALLDAPGSTLLCVPRLLTDDSYRAHVVRTVRDPVVRSFWLNEYAGYDRKFLAEANSPILNKIGRVLSSPAIRNIIAQSKSTIDLRKMMDEGRILIVNLSQGALGEGTAHLLGALITTGLAQAALSRADIPEHKRRVFHLYADEFQSFATESFALILSEARKYALTLTLGHQYLGQLSDALRQAVLGNTGSFIVFRVGAEDAPLVAHHLGLNSISAVQDLANFQAYGRFLVGNSPSAPTRLDLYPPPEPMNLHVDRLIANSRIRFGRDRHRVEERITRFLAA